MLSRLAEACFRHRRRVVVLWILGVIVLGAAMGTVGSDYRSDFTLPAVESKRGIDILDDQFGGLDAGQVGNIVFETDRGIESPEIRRVIEPFLAEVAEIDGVRSLESPYAPGNERQISSRR